MSWRDWIPRRFRSEGRKEGGGSQSGNSPGTASKASPSKTVSMGRPTPPPDLFRDQVKPHLRELFNQLLPMVEADWRMVCQNSLHGHKRGVSMTVQELSRGTSDLWKYRIRDYLAASVKRIPNIPEPVPPDTLEKVYQAFLSEFNSKMYDLLEVLFTEEQAKQITDRPDLTFGQAVLMYRKLGKKLMERDSAAAAASSDAHT